MYKKDLLIKNRKQYELLKQLAKGKKLSCYHWKIVHASLDMKSIDTKMYNYFLRTKVIKIVNYKYPLWECIISDKGQAALLAYEQVWKINY